MDPVREAEQHLLDQSETLEAIDSMDRAATLLKAGRSLEADLGLPLAQILEVEASVIRWRYMQDGHGDYALDYSAMYLLDVAKAVLRRAVI
jgi:hypothetical protein